MNLVRTLGKEEVQVAGKVVVVVVIVVDLLERWQLWKCVSCISKFEWLTHAVLLLHKEWESRCRSELGDTH